MSNTLADVTTIRLYHATLDQVWYACDEGAPTEIPYDLEIFLANVPSGSRLRVLSDRSLAGLACRLYEAADSRVLQLEIGRPASADWGVVLANEPAAILDRMATAPEVAPSLGGWRVMSAGDYRSLQGVISATPVEFLERHPAWPALAFLPSLNREKAAALLASVVDPRNFIKMDDADSDSRLKSFLGLGGRSSKAAAARCALAIGCWKDTWTSDRALKAQAENPLGFLARYWLQFADALDADTEVRRSNADEATARLFLRYLRANWLNALSDRAQRYQGCKHDQGLFIPEHFFFEDLARSRGDKPAVAAFKRHMTRFAATT